MVDKKKKKNQGIKKKDIVKITILKEEIKEIKPKKKDLETEIKEAKPEKKEDLETEIDKENDKIETIEKEEKKEEEKEIYKKVSLDYNVGIFHGSENFEQINNLDDLKNIDINNKNKNNVDPDIINNLYSINPKGSDLKNLYNSKNPDSNNLYNPMNKDKNNNPDSFIVQYKETASINNNLLYNGGMVDSDIDTNDIYQTSRLKDTLYSGSRVDKI